MAIATADDLINVLRQSCVLDRAQLEQAARELQPRFPEPRALVRELLRREWLTEFQARQLVQGRGADLVLGPYLLLDTLGKGGTGQVFKARHLKMNRLVAIKVLRPDRVNDPEIVQRFHREIEVASQLSHPNIVHAFEAGPIGSVVILAMEYINGPDLEQLVQQSGPLPAATACAYVRQAAVGLQYAHERGLVHRDIKPSNLLLTRAGPRSAPVVKLLDLGLARLQQPEPDSPTANLTMLASTHATQGTPDYMAPEQALDFHGADTRADIYSLGCTLFFLLAGRPPFSGSMVEKLMKHQQAGPPVVDLGPDLPPGLDGVLRRMMAKRPLERFQTPAAVVDALAPFCVAATEPRTIGNQALETVRSDFAESHAGGWGQRPRRLVRLLLLAGGALLLAVGGAMFLLSGAPKSPTTAAQAAPESAAGKHGLAKIGSYRANFRGPQPASGWRYLWNKSGPAGNPASYAPLAWDSTGGYTCADRGSPRMAANLNVTLNPEGGQLARGIPPGPRKDALYAVAAYTVQESDGAGFYRLIDSSLKGEADFVALVHVNGNAPLLSRPVPAGRRPVTTFDVDLGHLRPGDTIYVAVGPDVVDHLIAFDTLDFTLQRGGEDVVKRGVLLQDEFEELLPAWEFNPGREPFRLDENQPRHGKKSLRMTGPSTGTPRYTQVRRCVDENCVPGARYRARCWVRTLGLSGGGGVTSFLQFMGPGNKQIDLVGSKAVQSEERGWVQLNVEGKAPADTTRVVIGLVMDALGSAWFDDLEVTRELPTRP